MIWILTPFSMLFLLATGLSWWVAYLAWKRKQVKGAVELSHLMVAAGYWTFWLVFETAAASIPMKVFWSQVAYVGAVSTPVFYFMFVARFTGFEPSWLKQRRLILWILPAATLLAVFTNHYHHLVWPSLSAIDPRTNVVTYHHGPAFWLGYYAYSNVLLLAATILLTRYLMMHNSHFRSQAVLILVAAASPWISSFFYVSGVGFLHGIDIVPMSMVLSGLLFATAILKNRFLYLVPVARAMMVETMPDGIVVLDPANRIIDINKPAAFWLRVKSGEATGSTLDQVVKCHPRLLAALTDQAFEGAVDLTADTPPTVLSIKRKPIPGQEGASLLIISDISDQAEQQRIILDWGKRYESLWSMFRLMADNMTDWVWAKDLDARYTFANKAICEKLLFATDSNEPLGKPTQCFIDRSKEIQKHHPDWFTFGSNIEHYDQKILTTRLPCQYEESGNIRGVFHCYSIQKAPIINDKGELVGIVGSGRDITQQKAGQEALRKKEQLLNAVAVAVTHLLQHDDLERAINRALGVLGTSMQVNRVYIFRNSILPPYALPVMSQLFEWTDGRVEPQIKNPQLQNLPYETTCPRWHQELSEGRVLAGNVHQFPEIEKPLLLEQGILSMLVAPIFINTTFWGFIGFDDCNNIREWNRDETNILAVAANTIGAAYYKNIQQEELIKAKEKAEESDRLKSAFLANMSHEIRTPMNGILGFADLLKEPGLSGDEQKSYIELIETSGIRMLGVINDIIDISKIEAGLVEVNNQPFVLEELISGIFDFFEAEAVKRKIKFEVKYNLPSRRSPIVSDHDKLTGILINLIKNAFKYTSYGSVTLSCEVIEEVLYFYVADTGIGIPYHRQQAIFDRFVQADIADKEARQGSGLGLSIAKAYVEMLGGSIGVKSEPGIGSEFYFNIPYLPAPHQQVADAENGGKKPLVVMVLPDENEAVLLDMHLRKFNVEVVSFRRFADWADVMKARPKGDLLIADFWQIEKAFPDQRALGQLFKNTICLHQEVPPAALTTEWSSVYHASRPLKAAAIKKILTQTIASNEDTAQHF